MSSIAVLPSLTKTLTDLKDEDLYQGSPLAAPGLPLAGQLSSLLNIPDSFVEQYKRMNDNTLQLTPTQTSDLAFKQPYPYSLHSFCGFNAYNTLNDASQSLQFPPVSQNTPDHSLIRTMSRTARMRNRIQTLDPHLLTLPKKKKDDDSYPFNPDIQPSNIMNPNYFGADVSDNSFFVKKDDMPILNSVPVPGYEGDYLQLDDLEEDAEYLSEDSEDGDENFFQDHDEDDYTEKGFKFPDLMNNYSNGLQNIGFLRSFNSQGGNGLTFDETQLNYGRVLSLDDNRIGVEKLNLGYMPESYDDMETEETEPLTEVPLITKESDNEYSQLDGQVSPATPPTPKLDQQTFDPSKPSVCTVCLKQFSRPYDLIRHENTIHATKKKIFRCVICEGRQHGGIGNGTSKTFSRGDALTRHIKMKHGLEGAEAAELINEAKEHVEYVKN
ncbi:hypothetical protein METBISCDRAFT_21626 [Metschnikowia bicuspidata]|uniref:C2H2-type domain-containing protein n=1 Tax=Metschnikowia bicuspidata TaxID=27322 RepID=A0A4V1J3K3_9ASCO|nr:hypothetical protein METBISCDRAFT_21626 [Metschnikowia bicuspidata]